MKLSIKSTCMLEIAVRSLVILSLLIAIFVFKTSLFKPVLFFVSIMYFISAGINAILVAVLKTGHAEKEDERDVQLMGEASYLAVHRSELLLLLFLAIFVGLVYSNIIHFEAAILLVLIGCSIPKLLRDIYYLRLCHEEEMEYFE